MEQYRTVGDSRVREEHHGSASVLWNDVDAYSVQDLPESVQKDVMDKVIRLRLANKKAPTVRGRGFFRRLADFVFHTA